ncbi:hypothetical protein VHEMI03204 [[Torrubiella] hemipterigena]|uniref:ABC transporter domain-containing protein n=1 Tax=[Torrubiella] hemipterigena TaxID=1531966 RepID=A0A0A1SS02_9HYPO|nr:hypothetical protein VHEMI03204 [[Torrubiella] hemipterigena]
MRQLKMFGIEATIGEKTHRFRKMELDASKPFRLLIVGVNVLDASATALAPAVTIILYTVTRMNLATEVPKPDEIFTSLSLIALLASSVALLSLALTKFTSGIGSFDRIQDYLFAEINSGDSIHIHPNDMAMELAALPGSELVRVQGGSFRYGNDGDCQLNNMTFTVNRGEVVAVVGPLGCGKSSLLKAVLGEVSCAGGRLSMHATSVAYCQQTPYMFNGTIKNNITGDVHVDASWLEKVLFSCDLTSDIENLPTSLDTVVGASGLQLSGGQKQRVALARAVYAKPQLLLLDDVLTALDTITASRIFQRLFGPTGVIRQLQAGIMIVRVAPDQLLAATNKVIVLSEKGHIDAEGSYTDILATCPLLQNSSLPKDRSESSEDVPVPDSEKQTARPRATKASPVTTISTTAKSRSSGDLTLYSYYINSIGRLSFAFILGFSILYVVSLVFPQVLLSWWSGSLPGRGLTYLVTYTVLSILSVIAIGLSIGYFFVWAVP